MAIRKKYIEIKVRPDTAAQKSRYERAAKASGRTLSKWMLQAAEQLAGKAVGA